MASTDEKGFRAVKIKVEYEDNTENTHLNSHLIYPPYNNSKDIIVKSEGLDRNSPLLPSPEKANCFDFLATDQLFQCEVPFTTYSRQAVKTEPIAFEQFAEVSKTLNEVNPTCLNKCLAMDDKDALRDELESKTGVLNIQEIIVTDNQAKSGTKGIQKSSETIFSDIVSCTARTPNTDQSTSNDVAERTAVPMSSYPGNVNLGMIRRLSLKKFVRRKYIDGSIECIYFQCNNCEFETRSDVSFKKHMIRNHSSKFHPCLSCSKLFFSKKSLQTHKSMYHRVSKTFSCSKCDFTVHSPALLRRHKLSTHLKKAFKCDQCEYACHYESQLQSHMNRIHKFTNRGSKIYLEVYNCEVCLEGFPKLSQLSTHQKVHTGVRPYSCDYCDYSSYQSCNVKEHQLRKHKGKQISYTYDLSACSTSTHNKRGTAHNKLQKDDLELRESGSCSIEPAPKLKKRRKITKKVMVKDTVFRCQACNEQFPASKVLKRHLKYCVFNS